MARLPSRSLAWVFLSYVVVAALQAWPLPRHLAESLTGNPDGDTGVYVWNLWAFERELIQNGSNPFTTDLILAVGGPTDLSLHNYTVASDLLALPLLALVQLVTAFNLVYLLNVALTALGGFLLARHVTRGYGGTTEAWLAGLLFACSPFLVARSTGHFSLAAAAALPFFALWFDRAWQGQRVRDAAVAGACVAWATYSDPYYGIYCVLLGCCVMAGSLSVSFPARAVRLRTLGMVVDSLLVAAAVVVLAVAIFDADTLQLGPVRVSMRTLYTPVLVLTVLIGIRWVTGRRPQFRWLPPAPHSHLLRAGAAMALSAAALLSPLLLSMAARAASGRMVSAPVLWRSSAPGLDVLAFLAPNPAHPLAPAALGAWLAAQPGREGVASIPWVALAVIVVAWRWGPAPSRRLWLGVAVSFALLALGPFVRIGGVLTYIPTPWTLLRYVPVLGEARMPGRFAVLVILAVSVLFAGSLAVLAGRLAGRRRAFLAGIGAALAFELIPLPRALYPATIPAIYGTIASDSRPVAVLELPFGIKDGLEPFGSFTPRSQFHQTVHGKRLVGGYLSRISESRKSSYLASPVLGPFIALSEGAAVGPEAWEAAIGAAPDLARELRLGYVVMRTERVSLALRELAMQAFALERAGESDGYELFRVGASVSGERTADHAADHSDHVENRRASPGTGLQYRTAGLLHRPRDEAVALVDTRR
jgi:hypothetical protein